LVSWGFTYRQIASANKAGSVWQSNDKWRCSLPCEMGRFGMSPGPNVAITYCRLCNWLLRAAWMGQELLSTFAEELGSVTLIPDDTGGVFEVRIDGRLIWSRKEHGRFPEIKELKQIVRDEVAPGRDLGHVDHKEH
jgi:selenoprotein W-related protein